MANAQKKAGTAELHADKDAILNVVSCVDVANVLGLRMKKKGKRTYVECPFHMKWLGKPDHNIGNCWFNGEGTRCYCASCGGGGDAIHMVMDYEGMDFCTATDWIASVLAPHLLTNNWSSSGICPYTKNHFKAIGIHTEGFLIPIGMAPSKYLAKFSKLPHSDIIYPKNKDGNEDDCSVLLCQWQQMSIRDIYRDSKEAFFMIVVPKAKLAIKTNQDMIKSMETEDIPDSDTQAMVKSCKHIIRLASEFINDSYRYF